MVDVQNAINAAKNALTKARTDFPDAFISAYREELEETEKAALKRVVVDSELLQSYLDEVRALCAAADVSAAALDQASKQYGDSDTTRAWRTVYAVTIANLNGALRDLLGMTHQVTRRLSFIQPLISRGR